MTPELTEEAIAEAMTRAEKIACSSGSRQLPGVGSGVLGQTRPSAGAVLARSRLLTAAGYPA